MKPISTMVNTTPILNRGLNDGNWHDSVSEFTNNEEVNNFECD